MHPYLDEPPLAFAHRGGAASGDENTVEAFARAIALGYRYVEIDVHATADGEVVVFHDRTLRRMLGRADRVADVRWADLATLRIGGAAAVPRLADVLDAWPRVRFNVDVKSDHTVAPVGALLGRLDVADRVLLASFSDARLAVLRRDLPGFATSMGTREAARLWFASRTGRRIRPHPSVVAAQVPVRHGGVSVIDRRFVAVAHRAGLQVHAWTIDDAAQMTHLLDLGVDGIMTDRIEILRDVFTARGVWPA